MKIELKIALRYLSLRKKINFISIISFISIVGITIGVAALICVQSIFNGFRSVAEDAMLDDSPAIRISESKGVKIADYKNLLKDIEQELKTNTFFQEHCTSVPTIEQKCIISYKGSINVAQAVAKVNYDVASQKSPIAGRNPSKPNEASISVSLANRFNVVVVLGAPMQIYSLSALQRAVTTAMLPTPQEVSISGIVMDKNTSDNSLCVYVSENIARKIAKLKENEISYIDIYTNKNDYPKIDKTAETLKKVTRNIQVVTWKEMNADLYSVMQMERVAVFCVISLILLIAVFNVFASLSMLVVENKSAIAIMKSIGLNNKRIARVYIICGSITGLVGTMLGLMLGITLTLGQQYFHWLKIDSNIYLSDSIPVTLNSLDVVIIAVFSLLLAFVASVIPAIKSTKYNIIDGINND